MYDADESGPISKSFMPVNVKRIQNPRNAAFSFGSSRLIMKEKTSDDAKLFKKVTTDEMLSMKFEEDEIVYNTTDRCLYRYNPKYKMFSKEY
jgi:hypothetical protein